MSNNSTLSEGVLSRELLSSGILQQNAALPGGGGVLWGNEQIDRSLTETMEGIAHDNIWVFGYGSLIWNPIFPVAQSRTVKVYGFHRAFCLSSVVGRGSHDCPGLMLALDAGGSCRGVALKMGGDEIEGELRLLWRREMFAGSYIPKWVTAHSSDGNLRALAFVANRQRPNYIGRLPDEEAVCRLSTASGAFGSNLDYLRQTHAGLAVHGIHDPHVAGLLRICESLKQDAG
ncbi:gamma-glutamylcyclotransferase [Mesorhizobium sp. B2-3-5]|uniref:gamma-glutamylcyclotransferase n=1 Tax=Mesorhizobium sp. B2-3-5 TaxID=2589958 RepID=UPI0015E2DEE6|nr:gamma-glutamylcyclotransferase [Mesorhizobium sp. B2-3-5]